MAHLAFRAVRLGMAASRLFWVGVLLVVPGLTSARAADSEGRAFAISVDGKRAGDYEMNIEAQADGTLQISGRANVKVTVLGITAYHYSYRGAELWKGGRLLRLDTSCDDDGKQFQVSARAEGGALHVKVNGEEHNARADAWLTTYVMLPEARTPDQALPILDADTGRELSGTLRSVGAQQLSVGGDVQSCSHYRVVIAGGNEHDLWYDAHNRLARVEYVEDGHRVVYELVRVRR